MAAGGAAAAAAGAASNGTQHHARPSEVRFARRDLFGGAVSASLPEHYLDVSQVRGIPDHQEVWQDVELDQSVIVEIVEYQAQVPDDQAAEFFFRDLAGDNSASGAQVLLQQQLDPSHFPNLSFCQHAVVLIGKQSVAKYNEGEERENIVQIYMAVFRLPQHTSDILITLNDPILINPESSAAYAGFFRDDDQDGTSQEAQNAAWAFRQVLRSFTIHDFGLFG